jgi:NhaA family Na+:H+ antiporter
MATDIAFAVAALAVLGSRVPPVLKVFLLALAIVDDLGAVTVIAVFYTDEVRVGSLLLALLGLAFVYSARLAGVRAYAPYFLMGALIWLATLTSGVHATIAGVLLGLLTPVHPLGPGRTLIERAIERAREALDHIERGAPEKEHGPLLREIRTLSREAQSPLEVLTAALHPWVAFVVMPIFALANAGVTVDAGTLGDPIGTRVAFAIAVGLVVGKPLGIALFAIAAVRLGFATLPRGVTVAALVGTGLIAGIGFTMALFITELAFGGSSLAAGAKLGVLAASLVACIAGLLLLGRVLPRSQQEAVSH